MISVRGNYFFFHLGTVCVSCVRAAAHCSDTRTQCVDTMAERKQSHVWSCISSTKSQDAVCDVCGEKWSGVVATPRETPHVKPQPRIGGICDEADEEESTVSGAARERHPLPQYTPEFKINK